MPGGSRCSPIGSGLRTALSLYAEYRLSGPLEVRLSPASWNLAVKTERLRLVAPGGGSALLAVQSGGKPFVDWATVLRRTWRPASPAATRAPWPASGPRTARTSSPRHWRTRRPPRTCAGECWEATYRSLRVNAARILAKLPGQGQADDIARVLAHDEEVRRLYLTAVASRVCAVDWTTAGRIASQPASYARRQALGLRADPIQHIPTQRPVGHAGVVEVVSGVTGHADPAHHRLGTEVGGGRHRKDFG